jgi:lipoyl-dependent peroxiredoxin
VQPAEEEDMAVERRARSVWTGTLQEGEGKLTAESSGIFTDLPVTWASRSEERSGGKTSPEELLAAAHASCFSMALSNGLTKAGIPPERIEVTATATFQAGEGVKAMHLTVIGQVPGVDEDAFRNAAEDAKNNCPISKAVVGIPEITLDAKLQPSAA